jgi:hypothetical protein
MKWFVRTAILFLLLASFGSYLFLSRKVGYLILNRHATIEVNGTPVPGEMIEGQMIAVVTRRDGGREHSYELFFAGDADPTGDMGAVIDCHDWLAPRVPFLLVTRRYPPCNGLREGRPMQKGKPYCRRISIIARDYPIQFTTEDQTTIGIRMR